jgi:flagellar protein FliL
MAAKATKGKPKTDDESEEKDGKDGAQSAASKKRRLAGRTLVLFIILPFVLLLGGGAAAHFMGLTAALMGGGDHEEAEADDGHGAKAASGHGAKADSGHGAKADSGHGAKKAEAPKSSGHGEAAKGGGHGAKPAAGSGGAVFYALPEMIVNLNSTGRRSNFLKISVSLELAQSGDIARIEAVMPRIVDNFQTYLRELRVEDLRGSSGLFRLREELLARVSVAAAPAKINDILFKEMLVQ